MTTGHRIKITGWRMKDGKLVRSSAHKDISARLRERSSKRVRVVKGTRHDGKKA